MEVMNVYPFASGGRAAARRCSKDEAGGNDPTVAAGFSCSPDERQRHPGPAAAPHIAIAHAGYGSTKRINLSESTQSIRPPNAKRDQPPEPPDAPHHYRLRKL